MTLLFPAALCLAGRATAPAQEDFRSTLALDRLEAQYTNPPVELRPDPPRLGPVQLSLGLYTGAEFNDNIDFAPVNGQSDVILRGGVSLGAALPATERSTLRLSADIGYLHYTQYSAYDGIEVSPNSALTYDLDFTDGTLTFYDQFSYSREVVTQAALAGIAVFPRLDNTIGAQATWQPGHWLLQGGYSHEDFLGQTSQYQFLNHATECFTARSAWRFGENSQAGLEAGASLTAYQQSVQPNSDSLSLGAFTQWQVTHAIHAELRAGPDFFRFAAAPGQPGSDLLSYYYSLELSQPLTDFITHRVTVRRDVQLGYNAGSAYVEQLTATYGLSWDLTTRIKLSANLTYGSGSQPWPILIYEFSEHFSQYGINPSVSWRFTEHLGVILGYAHWVRQSDIPGRQYTQNSATLSLNYTF
jgi:hypothetical protein